MINRDKLKLDGESLLGLKDQIEALKESDGYLFNEKVANTGSSGNPSNKKPSMTEKQQLIDAYNEAEKKGDTLTMGMLRNKIKNL